MHNAIKYPKPPIYKIKSTPITQAPPKKPSHILLTILAPTDNLRQYSLKNPLSTLTPTDNLGIELTTFQIPARHPNNPRQLNLGAMLLPRPVDDPSATTVFRGKSMSRGRIN